MFASVALFGLLASAWGFDPQFLRTPLDGKIIGGTPIDIKEAPYQISLQIIGEGQVCGGSIISSKYIVTAAHCVPSYDNYAVRAGSSYSDQGGVVVNVSKVSVHPKYVEPDYDIAVLELENDLKFNEDIKPISLPNYNEEVPVGAKSLTSGWGATKEGDWGSSQLLAVEVPIIAHEKCQKLYSEYGNITRNMICAGFDEGGKDACQGDSGGPLVVNGKLVGVVSWGKGCARPKLPGVYSSVSVLRQFVKDISGI